MRFFQTLKQRISGVPFGQKTLRFEGMNDVEPPLREELFSNTQLESHARSLAAEQILDFRPSSELLLHRLDENEEVIRKSYEDVADAVRRGRPVSAGAEWLLDNYYLIEEQIDHIRLNFPSEYSQKLPRLGTGYRKGFPRVYDLALELVSHTDGRVDVENISNFLRVYQSVRPLKLGELWAMPLMIGLALVENLRRVSYRIAWRRRHRGLALEWSGRFIQIIQKEPRSLITVLADFVRSNPPMSAPFLAELTADLQGRHPSLGLVINWVEQELAEHGQTLELIQQADSHDQAADHASIGNSITSLRKLSTIEWKDFVESLSAVEAVLRRDPLNIHAQMDFRSRDICRHQVEELSKFSGMEEDAVAEAAINMAQERMHTPDAENRQRTASYFLTGEGRPELESRIHCRLSLWRRLYRGLKRHALPVYLLSFGVLTCLATVGVFRVVGFGPNWTWFVFAMITVGLVISRSVISIINWIVTIVMPSQIMLRLDFSKGIPPEYQTAVVVPSFLSGPEAIEKLLERLEVRYLANRSPNLVMALLTDFTDAPKETMPEDQALLDAALAGIRRLNLKYAAENQTVFHILHRPRLWNPAEKCWMGYERKRGKLTQFNQLVTKGITAPFSIIEGDIPRLRNIRYVIVLDADTALPPQSVWKMAGTMGHPLNRPRIDAQRGCVDKGYGMLQPRLATSLPSSQRSLFVRLFAGDVGLDPYTREVSNVYQDLFGQAQFVGKGIYDIKAFDATVGDCFPENRILSHDMIEGCYARCGFLNDMELLEEHPSRYLADVSRRFRWARGDWQIARWLLPVVPGPQGKSRRNPLGLLSKWMIIDNLRRTLVPLALFVAFLLGWFGIPDSAMHWTALLAAIFFLPNLLKSLRAIAVKSKYLKWSTHITHALGKELRLWTIDFLDLLLVPFNAFIYLKAILLTAWRLIISRRHLLEWQTASDANEKVITNLTGIFGTMWIAPASAVLIAVLFSAGRFSFPADTLNLEQYLPEPLNGPMTVETLFVLLAGWFVSPVIAWWLSLPTYPSKQKMSDRQKLFLRKMARRTWAYFEHLVGPENHWLPPDNFQEDPFIGEACRTSPTNIGMALLSNLAACDFGYISVKTLMDRSGETFKTMEELPRYHGHFYNWYDTQTLHSFYPRYISTADSGNLSGSLITLGAGFAELAGRPILPEGWRKGLEDTAQILLDELRITLKNPRHGMGADNIRRIQKAVTEQIQSSGSAADTLSGTYRAITLFASTLSEVESLVRADSEPDFWFCALRNQCEDLRNDLIYLAPWLDLYKDANRPQQDMPFADRIPSLHELANLKSNALTHPVPGMPEQSDTHYASSLPRNMLELSATRAAQRITALENLQNQCRELSETDMSFLYDVSHRLTSIGYNRDTHQRDPGYYDLLASEARLSSFLGVALGQLPVDHWFCLGRQFVPGGKAKVLISWSGSMFEYLMPLLVMPLYEATLLYESCREAVRRQISYGLSHGTPWGFSESCFNQIDTQKVYQYRGFGVAGLGLKRGLKDDLVVAPYAAALALMIKPSTACRNLQEMAEKGFVGRYGFYEAIDYTHSRIPQGKNFAIVRTYMAHHSGMSLLAIDNSLMGNPMQRRFLSDPRIRAYLLLLQERIPVTEVRTKIGIASEKPGVGEAEPAEIASRSFTRADLPVPDVHLLSNGRYHVLITSAGSGSSRWENLSLTRWQEDTTRDHWGTFLYLSDIDTGNTWSVTAQPMCSKFDHYEATFFQGAVEFQSIRDKVKVQMRAAVSSEDDMELRRLLITNLSGHSRNFEITSYAEVVLLNGIDACEQPAFHGLFVQTEIVPEKAAILCMRRPKSPEESWPVFFHGMVVHDVVPSEEVSFETDRWRFLGRCRTAADAAAMKNPGALSGTCGAVLDPVMSVRRRIHLGPGQSVTLDAIWGVGQDRSKALSLLDKYYDHHLADRVFEMAWTHSQVMLHRLQARESDSQLFSQLAGLLIYSNPRLRSRPSLIARNRRGQSDLWAYGISGDLPIVTLRVSDQSGLDLVRQMLKAHAYWRSKGLRVDLVILCEAYMGYRQSLMDAIIGLVNASLEAKELNQPAGIFVRNIDHVPEEDRMLLRATSRIVLSDRVGTLAEHLERHAIPKFDLPLLKPTRKPAETVSEDADPPHHELLFFNGWGGFTHDGREYVVILRPGSVTPAPWVNVLANPGFGSVVSESGGAYTWYQNAHEFRLTSWYNDAVGDVSGEAFYIRDEETGRFWSPTPWPTRGRTSYVSRHGLGYSAFEHTEDRIFSEVFTYVAPAAPLKFTTITLRNLSKRNRKLSLTGYVEWVLGESRARHSMYVVNRLDSQSGAIFAGNNFKADFNKAVAFFHCSHPQRTLTTSRTEFLGRNGSLSSPAAMRGVSLSNHVGTGGDPCGAIQAYVEIPPGEQVQVVFVLGAADSEQQARAFLAQSSGVDGARRVLEDVWDMWKRNLGGIYVETPDASVNLLVNHWLLYQTLACRFWGRSGFYQSGGAFGFRDQLQDSLAFLYECPWLTRQHLLTCSSRQFHDGDVQHWWHPPLGRGVRTRISDDYLWLVYVACRYIAATGDTGVLDEQIPFLEAAPLDPAEESHYGMPQVSEKSVAVYDHCVRALNHAMRYGSHGLPLMGSGDWNDGMNRVGCKGSGESVWLAFFLYDILQSFEALARQRNDNEYAEKCRTQAKSLQDNIEACAWDGQWYLRAFFDDGSPLGSAQNSQCRVDLLPQAWAVLSGAVDPQKAGQALQTALNSLIDPKTNTIRLLYPPFDGTAMDPGYICGYIPGVRENGGQYTHAAIWAAIAVARTRNAEQAWKLFSMLNPIGRADSPEAASVYKVEPYVMSADVYSAAGHEGRGGWTWYTGSSGWMYQLLVEHLLGLRVEVNTLSFSPLLPAEWNEYTLHYCYRNTFFHIRIVKTGPQTWNVRRVLLDNVEQQDKKIHLVDDRIEHYAVVEVGMPL
jgi:cellobiose phosphorylase